MGGGGSENKWDLTSGRWPRWVARYEKGGWAVHFNAMQSTSGSIYEKWGGGGGGGCLVPSLICIRNIFT